MQETTENNAIRDERGLHQNPAVRHFHYAEELLAAKIDPPRFIVNPIIPRGRLLMGVGDSTQGKTPFGTQMGRDVAARRDFLDLYKHCQEPTRVALFDAESPKEDLALRLRMQQAGRPLDTADFLSLYDVDAVFREGFDLTESGLKKIRELVADVPIDLLILDNLWALSGGRDIVKANEVQPILRGLRRIVRLPHSPSVLLFHHPRKTDKRALPDLATDDFARWGEEASGSRIIFNLTDVRFGLQRTEIDGDPYTIFRGRSRVPGSQQDFGPIYLTIDDEYSLASITRRPELMERLGEKERRVLDAMRDKKRFGVINAKHATKGEISDKTIRRAYNHGCEYGVLRQVEPGVYDWVA